MAVYPDSIKIEIYTTSWVDISSKVVKTIECSYGIISTKLTDRVASTGTLKLDLNNIGETFSPGRATAIAGFKVGIPLRLTVTFGGESVVKFYGHITNIKLDTGSWGERLAKITVSDWFEYAFNYPITLTNVLYNQKIGASANALIQTMPIQPLMTTISEGVDVFPTVFDTGKGNTRATSEFNKLALSEWGYIYLRKNENLVVEGRHDRNFLTPVTSIPISTFKAGLLKQEDNTYLLLETGDNFLLNETQQLVFNDNMTNLEVTYGVNLKNYVSVTSYPRRIDTSAQILYSVGEPISLSAGETKANIKVTYRDPTQTATKVAGMNMITPVANTDYKMYQASTGTGFDLTSYLTVTVTFGANDALITLVNSGSSLGYVTMLNLRGLGIYTYESLEFVEQDTGSINQYGYSDLSIDQKYQDDINVSKGIASLVLSENKAPVTNVNGIDFLANYSDELFQAFLYGDVGDLISVTDDSISGSALYYINGVKYTINQGGIINYTYILGSSRETDNPVWVLGVTGYSELDTKTILGV